MCIYKASNCVKPKCSGRCRIKWRDLIANKNNTDIKRAKLQNVSGAEN